MLLHDDPYALSGCACGDPYNYRSYTTPHSTYANRAVVLPRLAPLNPTVEEQPYYLREAAQTPSMAPLVSRAVPLSGALAGVQAGAVNPPEGTTAEGRIEALEQQWAEARAKAQSPEYAGQKHAQGTDLPMSLDGPMILNTMVEVDYYLDPKGWERCTINQWLNGTPSEDDLGFGSSIKKQFTAPVLEADPPQGCGDHSYGNQYEDAFKALAKAGAPERLIKLIRERGSSKLATKAPIFKSDAEKNIGAAAGGTFGELTKYLLWGAVIYAAVTFGPALLKKGSK